MKKLISRWKREDGAVAVFMALAMTAMMGFTALAVDVGLYNYQKSLLQTACDSAALAACQKLPDTSAATATAKEYIRKNNFTDEDVVVEVDADTVKVSSAKQQETYFANIFGIQHLDYDCLAKAEKRETTSGEGGQYKSAFDYLIFQGKKETESSMPPYGNQGCLYHPDYLGMGGTQFTINGSVHSNCNFYASPGTWLTSRITGAAEACGTVFVDNPNKVIVPNQVPNADFIPMPDFTDCVNQVMPTTWNFNPTAASINAIWSWWGAVTNGNTKVQVGDVSVQNGMVVNGNLYIQGNLTVNGPGIKHNGGLIYVTGNIVFGNTYTGNGCIFAGGNILFQGGVQQVNPNSSTVSIYSQNGNIDLTAASAVVRGIVYAPNGSIKLAGQNPTFYGSIIANRIEGIPAKLTMYSNDVDLPFTLPTGTSTTTVMTSVLIE